MTVRSLSRALALAIVLTGCTLPLTEGPTPLPVLVEPSPTASEPTVEAPPTDAPEPGQISAQNLGSLHLVGEFTQDLTGALDWSPDSTLLALTTIHGAGIFELERLLKLRPLLSETAHTSLAFSAEGERVVTGGTDLPQSPQYTVTIWQVSDGSKLQTMIGHSDWINAVDYSPTGEFVASGSDDGTVRLWRVEQGSEAMVLQGHDGWVTAVAFSPDGRVLASGGVDGVVRLWRASDGQQLMELLQGELPVLSLAFSPDGITLAVGSRDGLIRLFAAGTGAPLATLAGNDGIVTDLDFSPDGSLLVASGEDNSLRFWQVSSGIQLHVLAAHNAPLLSVSFAPNGRYVASGSLDGSVRVWGLGEPFQTAATPEPAGDPIQRLAAGTELQLDVVHMFASEQGWALGGGPGESVHVFRTEDGGSTWLEVTPPQSAQPVEGFRLAATGHFHDPYTGWLVYYPVDFVGGPVELDAITTWRTSDGGLSWAMDRPTVALDLNEGPPLVSFADDRFGWLLAEFYVGVGQHGFALLRTIDSGFTWQPVLEPPDTLNSCHKTGLALADADYGWITEECPPELGAAVVLVSRDGGQSLEPIALPAPQSDPDFLEAPGCTAHSPHLFAPEHGLLAVECGVPADGYIYTSQDNGQSWTTSAYPGGGLRFLNEQVGWALSQRIYKTVNGGATWVLVKTVQWNGRFSFPTAELGWAIASSNGDAAFVQTTDGARRWTLLEPIVAP